MNVAFKSLVSKIFILEDKWWKWGARMTLLIIDPSYCWPRNLRPLNLLWAGLHLRRNWLSILRLLSCGNIIVSTLISGMDYKGVETTNQVYVQYLYQSRVTYYPSSPFMVVFSIFSGTPMAHEICERIFLSQNSQAKL